ncbi:MAG: hypothetical protein WCX63_02205 [Methanoregula sp.]
MKINTPDLLERLNSYKVGKNAHTLVVKKYPVPPGSSHPSGRYLR